MEKQYQIKTPDEFIIIIEEIMNFYKSSSLPNLVITLEGSLGAGKTAFTKKLGEYLGIKEVIVSPTFNIMKQYEVESVDFEQLVHIDAYRLEDFSEIKPLGLAEIISAPNKIVCIEWPEIMAEVIPKNSFNLGIVAGENEIRTVLLKTKAN
jgi:tRNA threonylcarbamoyladenosine biosynthesis protein TsaE